MASFADTGTRTLGCIKDKETIGSGGGARADGGRGVGLMGSAGGSHGDESHDGSGDDGDE